MIQSQSLLTCDTEHKIIQPLPTDETVAMFDLYLSLDSDTEVNTSFTTCHAVDVMASTFNVFANTVTCFSCFLFLNHPILKSVNILQVC